MQVANHAIRAGGSGATPRASLDFLWLELTEKCNLTCGHCYVGSGPDRPLHQAMRHDDWIATIREAAQLGCRSLQFIGGEPLLYPRIEELIAEAQQRGFGLIEVYSNATPITPRRSRLFAERGVRIATSVYSDDPATHDRVTGVPGSFERTMTALRRLVADRVPVRVGFIEMEANRGAFERTRAMLARLGIERVACDAVRDFGRGSNLSDPGNDFFAGSAFAGLCGQCSRGRLCVTASGAVYPCIMGRSHRVGSVLEGGLVGVLDGAAIGQFRSGMTVEMRSRIEHGCAPLDPPGGCGPDVPDPPEPPPCMPINSMVAQACAPLDPPPDDDDGVGCMPKFPDIAACAPPDPCMVCGPGNCGPDFADPPEPPMPTPHTPGCIPTEFTR